jgi:hypothetical protein
MEGSLLDETLQLPVKMIILREERVVRVREPEGGKERPGMTVELEETGRKVNREQLLDRFDIFGLTQPYILISLPGVQPKASKDKERKLEVFFHLVLHRNGGHAFETFPEKSSASFLSIDGKFKRELWVREEFGEGGMHERFQRNTDPGAGT